MPFPQVLGRVALMAVLVGRVGVLAVPAAFALMACVELALLGTVLLVKLRRRLAPSYARLGVAA